ncbi:MAG: LysR family transcriptional regulator [Bacilli bacterium]|nr:LysR family transcriptional regulator [Bacilli bacterium]
MLERLKQLVTISEVKTLSKASEILLISQPALTRSIQKLEEELDIKLFDRTKNKIVLNDNGELAVKYAKKIIKETEEMKNNLKTYDQNKKMINIGAIAPMPIIGLKYIFNNLYPQTQITDNMITDESLLLKGLDNNEYSVIVLSHPIEDKKYICNAFFEEKLYLSLPLNHPMTSLKDISFEKLNGTSVLLRSKLGYWRELKEKVIPNSVLIFQEDEIILNELIRSSSLPSFRTDISLQRLKEPENRTYIPFINKEAHVQFYIIYKKKDKQLFEQLKAEIKNLDWSKT